MATITPANENIQRFNSTTNKWENTKVLNDKTIIDNSVAVVNNTDDTKKLIFDASGITTSTTRTQKFVNQDGTLVATNITNRVHGSFASWDTNTNEYEDNQPLWADLIGKVEVRNNAQAPTMSNYFGDASWYEWLCNSAGNANTYFYFSYHLPHDYIPGTNLFFHVHHSVNVASLTGNIYFQVQAFYGKSGSLLNSSTATTTITQAVQPQYQHVVSETQLSNVGGTGGLLDTSLIETDGLLFVILRVQNNNANYTLSNKGALYVHQADIHYLSTIGTKNKVAPFNN